MRCVLIQNDRVHVENEDGVVVFFNTLEEAELYTNQDFSGARGRRITYQPSEGINDWDGSARPLPMGNFEALIDSVETLKADQDNPFSHVSLEEAKIQKIREVTTKAVKVKRSTYNAGANVLSVGGLQSLEDIQTQAILATAAGDSTWTILVIMENMEGGINVRRPFTASQCLAFIRNIWVRNESINQIAQNNIDSINALTTVEAVANYVIVNQ